MAHKNPISNPEDHALYRSRVAALGAPARLRKEREEGIVDLVAAVPKIPLRPRKTAFPTAKHAIEYGPLRAWMKHFAVWLIQHDQTPVLDKQLSTASRLAKSKVTRGLLYKLRRRVDFIEYLDTLQADAAEQAKAEYEALYPQMTEVMRQQLAAAQADPRQYKRAEKIILQGVERFAPKKQDAVDGARTVHIHLNARTQRIMETAIEPMVDVEVVKADPVDDG